MDVSEMIFMCTDQANVSTDDFDNVRVLKYINLVKADLWSFIITGIKSNYNWDIWKVKTGDIVVGRTEYRTPEAASDSEGNLKINGVSICYKGKTNNDGTLLYKKAREVNPNTLPNHWSYYANNQSESDPIYFVADKSIFIAPHFSQVVEQGIELRGIKSIADYEEGTEEKNTGIPYGLHPVIILGVIEYIKKAEQLEDAATLAGNNYRRERQLAMEKISNRATGPYTMRYPDQEYDDDDIGIIQN